MPDPTLRLLIIGGYGSFGARLVRLLAEDPRLAIIVAGRSLRKAESFAGTCDGPARVIPALLERDGDLLAEIERHAPDYVIDMSGPWQAYPGDAYKVARAAIAAGAGYLDLADSPDFVLGIDKLDTAALDSNVAVISGLSTCPALTAAVVEHLESDFASVDRIAGGIAPSPFVGLGLSVIEAVASYAGKPVHLYRDGRETTADAFADTLQFTIAPPRTASLPSLTFSLIDVPDLRLLRRGKSGRADVWFGVSTRPAIYHALLRFIVRFVSIGLVRSIVSLSRAMHFVMDRLTWGEHRGGMFVELSGTDQDGQPLRKSWHLLAEGDAGPNVPVLAPHAIIESHLEGRPPEAGARNAAGELSLRDFEPMFEQLGINTGVRSDPPPDSWPLFRRVIGSDWVDMPDAIRALHGESGDSTFTGRASVKRGQSLSSKLIGRIVGFPEQAEDVPVTVRIDAFGGKERWQRDFDGHRFSSVHSSGKDRMRRLICERFGPVRIGMSLFWDGRRLRYVTKRWTILGIPMPRFLAPGGDVYEFVEDGRFRFHVDIRAPLAGHLVTYEGWLVPDG